MNDCSKEMWEDAVQLLMKSCQAWPYDIVIPRITQSVGINAVKVFYWFTRPFHQLVSPHLALDAFLCPGKIEELED